MDRIWANRLIAGTKTWNEMPESRRESVKLVLEERVKLGIITKEQMDEIIGA